MRATTRSGPTRAPRYAQAMFDDFATVDAEPLRTISLYFIL